jgi:hypothetical protein
MWPARAFAGRTPVRTLGHEAAIAGAGFGWSLWGAMSASEASAWGGALVALVALAWGVWRDQRSRDEDRDRRRRVEDAVADARVAAFREGKPDPYPEWPGPDVGREQGKVTEGQAPRAN